MKLGYRERITILVVIVIVILGLGIFLLIKPAWEKLSSNKETRDQLQSDWDAKLLEFDRIPARQDNIKQRYKEGVDLSAEFTDEMTSVELDKFLREKFINTPQNQEDEVKVKDAIQISDISTSSLNYYYYVPNIVTYPLYESADLDGSLALDLAQKLLDSNILSARSSQTVGSSAATIKLLINREDTMTLLDAVNEYAAKNKDAMIIEAVQLKEADFNEKLEVEEEEAEQQVDDEGNPVAAPKTAAATTTEAGAKKDYTEVTISYRAYYMQEPTEPDVGPAYDKTIWDGDAWRTAAAE